MSARNGKLTFTHNFQGNGINLLQKTLSLQRKQKDKDDCRQTTKVFHTDNTTGCSRFRQQSREQRVHSSRVSAVCLGCRTGLPQLGNVPITYRPCRISAVNVFRLQSAGKRTGKAYKSVSDFQKAGKAVEVAAFVKKDLPRKHYSYVKPFHRLISLGRLII